MNLRFCFLSFQLLLTLSQAWIQSRLNYWYKLEETTEDAHVVGAMLNLFLGDWTKFVAGHTDVSPYVQADPEESEEGNEALPALPNEMWQLIFLYLDDFEDFLALCQLSKATNFLMRSRPLFDHMLHAGGSAKGLYHLISETELKFPFQILPFLDNMLATARDAKGKDKTKAFQDLHWSLVQRAKDLTLIKRLHHYSRDCNKLPFKFPKQLKLVGEHLYVVKGRRANNDKMFEPALVEQYVWLPPAEEDRPLLHIFDEKFVAAVFGGYKIIFRGMFSHFILAELIIPAYNGDYNLDAAALKPYEAFMESGCYLNYFYYLFRAVNLLSSGKVAANGRAMPCRRVKKINAFLKSLGFNIGRVHDSHPNSVEWRNDKWKAEDDMWSVFRAAQHWNLPWKRIAAKTKDWCKLSQQIMAGEIPEGLEPWAPLTPQDVFKVSYPHETAPKQVFVNQKTGAIMEPSAKGRKRMRQRKQDNGYRNKRQRLEGLNSQMGALWQLAGHAGAAVQDQDETISISASMSDDDDGADDAGQLVLPGHMMPPFIPGPMGAHMPPFIPGPMGAHMPPFIPFPGALLFMAPGAAPPFIHPPSHITPPANTTATGPIHSSSTDESFEAQILAGPDFSFPSFEPDFSALDFMNVQEPENSEEEQKEEKEEKH